MLSFDLADLRQHLILTHFYLYLACFFYLYCVCSLFGLWCHFVIVVTHTELTLSLLTLWYTPLSLVLVFFVLSFWFFVVALFSCIRLGRVLFYKHSLTLTLTTVQTRPTRVCLKPFCCFFVFDPLASLRCTLHPCFGGHVFLIAGLVRVLCQLGVRGVCAYGGVVSGVVSVII